MRYSVSWRVVLVILLLIPLISLITLLVLNSRATKALRAGELRTNNVIRLMSGINKRMTRTTLQLTEYRMPDANRKRPTNVTTVARMAAARPVTFPTAALTIIARRFRKIA